MRLRFFSIGILLGVVTNGCQGKVGTVGSLPGTTTNPAEVPGMGSVPDAGSGTTAETPQCKPSGELVVPRRVLRLTNQEVAASFRGLFQIDDAALPASWSKPLTPEAPNSTGTVSRDFLEQVSAVATAAVDKTNVPSSCSEDAFGTDPSCTKALVTSLARTAFRGQEDAADIEALSTLALEIGARSGPADARTIVRRALAMSPKFLYLFEGVADEPLSKPSRMRPVELASFLSFRLTGGPPPQDLQQALEAQPALDTARLSVLLEKQFGPQVLADATQGFLSAWSNVPAIGRTNKDLVRNPIATPAFMATLQTETWNALGAFSSKNATLKDVLTENGRSVALMDVDSAAYRSVGRPGIFTLPGVVAAMSGAFETNLPRRGRALLNKLFCENLSSPPAGAVAQAPPLAAKATQRERFVRIEERAANCAACHLRIDGLAFPLEIFDEIGRVRQTDEFQNMLQLNGEHSPLVGPRLIFKNVNEMLDQASALGAVQSCFASQLFSYFARQPTDSSTASCTGDALVQRARQPDGALPLNASTLEALLLSSLAPRGD
jgi:Protein of unknown function (DUF1588)/Protein of unknown function (DUF1592)